jgi:hypothetical protein
VYGAALKLKSDECNDISYLFLFNLLYQLRWQRKKKGMKDAKASRHVASPTFVARPADSFFFGAV